VGNHDHLAFRFRRNEQRDELSKTDFGSRFSSG
jgi:hypothetical protein